MTLKQTTIDLSDFNRQMRRVASIIPGGQLANALKAGQEIILEEAKDNIIREDLIKSGALYDSGKTVKVNQWRVDTVFDKPYAAAQEYGLPKGGVGVWEATEQQIRFFWAKFLESKKTVEMWKALALKRGYTIPAKPYLSPAVRDKKFEAVREVAKQLAIALTNKLRGV